MSSVDTSGWKKVGVTSNSTFYEVTPELLAMVPNDGSTDTAETARESLAWQRRWWREKGHTGCLAVFVDAAGDQDAGARAVYADPSLSLDALSHAAVLIGGTFWARSVSKVFLTIRDHPVPMRHFATLADAMPWIEEMNRTRGRKL